MTDPTALDIAEAGAALRARALRAEDLLDAYLARIERYDGRLNAYITVLANSAWAEARAADERHAAGQALSPLDGIPIALKDNIDIAGVVTSNGMRRDVVAATNAAVVERLKSAGAVLIGKLSMHEGALGGTTNNAHHGATHNPWRFGHSPGGSSGGSGAAVAARLCAGALGTDTLGSVRLPAAYCGITGLKATTGLISTRGVMPLSYALDHVGPLARSVRDLGLMTEVLAGYDAASPESCAAPAGWQAWRGPVKRLEGHNVGVITNFADVEMEPPVADGFAQSLDVLRALGAEIRQVKIADYEPTRARLAGYLISEAEGAVALADEMAATPTAFSEPFWQMLLYGRDTSAAKLVQAQRLVAEAGATIRRLFDNVDLLATPTAPQLAFSFNSKPPANQADFTAIANYGRCPAVSVPCGLSGAGLPLALQLLAAPFAEASLLAAAAAFQAAVGPMPTAPEHP